MEFCPFITIFAKNEKTARLINLLYNEKDLLFNFYIIDYADTVCMYIAEERGEQQHSQGEQCSVRGS